MIGPYKINRPTRRCAATGDPLRPSQWYISVLSGDEDDLVRRDYAADQFTEPPADAIGHWKRQMPPPGPKKMVLAEPAVLVDLLRQMQSFPDRSDVRYVLALLLMRKRLVEPAASTADSMTLNVLSDGSQITVDVVDIPPARAAKLADQLQEMLYCEVAEDEVAEDEVAGDDAAEDNA